MIKREKGKPIFVVHEHHASHLHYDFRLEIEGVLKSWAIPKGPSMNPTDKRLAIMVEDHPLEYARFEGIIPEGHYGAGAVVIWDRGYYLPLGDKGLEVQLKMGKMDFILQGKRLKGAFTMMLFRGRKNQWLLIKKNDDYADKTWKIELALTKEKRHRLKLKTPPCKTKNP
ncbi:MAG: 3'-phosphoesterase [Deltaproteobacteria bacterium]|nr:3'-phosphoesterase [Deltaproteobacteria bacterium]